MSNTNSQYILSAQVLESLFQYLSRKPYQEVNVLIQMLQGAQMVNQSKSTQHKQPNNKVELQPEVQDDDIKEG